MAGRLPGVRKNEILPKGRQRVLLIDDDLKDLLLYSAVLQREGYEVRSLASYREGAECFERGDFDLVIVSQGTAAFEGRLVLSRVFARERSIPVFVLSRSSDVDCYLEAMQMGVFDYREKPIAASELAQMVARHLRPGRFRAA